MNRALRALWQRATPRRLLLSFSGVGLLLLGENLLDVPPGVVYMRRVTQGQNFLDFGFAPASQAHAVLTAFGPAGRHTQALLLSTVDVLIPFASGLFGALAIVVFGRALLGKPGRWLGLVSIPILAMLLDYAENASIAALLVTFPRDPAWLSVVTHALTQAKTVFYGSTALLVALGGAAALIRHVFKRQHSLSCV
jgi:hypothetical protein